MSLDHEPLAVGSSREPEELLALFSQQTLHPFGNAQSFHPEHRRLYFTLSSPAPNGTLQAAIVRSDGNLLPYTLQAIQDENFYPLPSTMDPKTHELIPPSVLARWSPQSLKDFLGAPTPRRTAAEVYQALTGYLQRFVYHNDRRVLELVALCTMASYVHSVFEALPLLLITGERGTGKTRLVEIVSELGFNGKLRGSLTSAALSREAPRDQPLLCIDEAEELGNGHRHQETCRLLRLMYRRSGTREVCGPGGTSQVFHLFCPVILVNIVGVDDALRDRTIEVQTVRRKRPVERFLLHQQHGMLQQLRDELYCFACTYAGQVYKAYLEFPSVSDISDRNEELWLPIFVLAKVIDTTSEAPELFDKMVKFAGELGKQKAEQEQFVARDTQIIAGLYFFLECEGLLGNPTPEVNAAALTASIKIAEHLPELRIEEVSRVLSRAKIIDKRLRRRILGTTSSTNPLVHYQINVKHAVELAKTLEIPPKS
jgi:hypothetical protein